MSHLSCPVVYYEKPIRRSHAYRVSMPKRKENKHAEQGDREQYEDREVRFFHSTKESTGNLMSMSKENR